MGWQLSLSQHFELAQLRELNGVGRHGFMKQAWDHQLELDSPLCGAHKVNSKTPCGQKWGWMQSAKLPYLARGGENISLDIPFYRIPLSQVPRRNTFRSTPTLRAGAPVDRALRFCDSLPSTVGRSVRPNSEISKCRFHNFAVHLLQSGVQL